MAPKRGSRSKLLTAQIDLYPTIAEALNLKIPKGYVIHGFSMLPALRGKARRIRDIAHSSYFGTPVMVTDGRHALHKFPARPDNGPLFAYGINLDAFHRRVLDPYRTGEVGRFLPFTDAQVFRLPVRKAASFEKETEARSGGTRDLLFDLRIGDDLSQNILGDRPEIAARLRKALVREYERIGAPSEQYERLGLR
jgi:hypothetical protein